MPGGDQALDQFALAFAAAALEPDFDRIHQPFLAMDQDIIFGRQSGALDGLVGKGLHLAQQALLAGGDQRNGDAGLAGAAGAPDAVNVQLGVIRQVIVEDVRDVVDIQATRGHIGGHQHFDLGIAEAVEGAFTRHPGSGRR